MSDATPHLGLPLIAAAQAQKHVTHNEALGLLDALVQLACLDKDLSAPPASPAEGDRYLVTAGNPTGAWAGLAGQVVRFSDGVWAGAVPRPGWFAYVIDEADLYIFDGTAWTSFRRAITQIQLTSRLGINTTPDAANRLAVKSDAALLSFDDITPGSGDMRVAVNKQAAARDAAIVFQTGYSARALLGTLGADDFSLKVSGDGAAFSTVLTASAATGGVDFASSETVLAGAATTDLGAPGTRRILVAGSAAITSFGASPNRERFVRFSGTATLTHDATRLVLPTRANILTAADDTCIASSDAAGNWRVRHYQRADGTALVGGGVASVAGRTGAVTLTVADVSGAAPLASPTLAGTPTAPNPAAGTNTAQVATTSFVAASFVTYAYAAATYATIASPTLTGTPTAPTPAAKDNSTKLATTAYADRGDAAALARTQVNDAAYTILATDRTVAVIALTAARTLTLPAASAYPQGATLLVVDESGACSATNAITLARAGSSDTVNGGAATVIASAYGYLALASNGANKWTVVDAIAPVSSVAGRTGAVTLAVADVSGAAPLASPALTGTPTAPTPAAGTNTTQVATTAFVASAVTAGCAGSGVPTTRQILGSGLATGGGDLSADRTITVPKATQADMAAGTDDARALTAYSVAAALAAKAPLASPALTGTPTAPTAAADTATTQLASTAFVVSQAAAATPLMDATAAVGTATRFARADHVHPTDTSRAPLASPALTGTPTAPTAATSTNTTQIATTAFVLGQAATANPAMNGSAGVGSSALFARQDHVHPTDTSRAPLASPAFTGTPTAPTATSGDNSTTLATTAFVTSAVAAGGGSGGSASAVLYTSQSLSQAQKVQARLNTLSAGNDDLIALAIQVAKVKGSLINLFDAADDDFQDSTGIDTANSVNATRVSGNNTVVNSSADANTKALLHFDGTNGATTFSDDAGHTFTAAGSAAISTAQSVFGGASGLFNASGATITGTSSDFTLGTGDFAFEFRLRLNSTGARQYIYDGRTSGNLNGFVIFVENTGVIVAYDTVAGAPAVTGSTVLSANTWYSIQVSRASGTMRIFVNGNVDSSASNTTNFSTTTLRLGDYYGSGLPTLGYLDEFRLSNIARNTAAYTPASSAFSLGGVGALDLRSVAFTAQAVPAKASLYILLAVSAGTLTLNTNLTASASRDGGTTWTAFTLAQTGALGSTLILEANGLDISGQPSGTAMKYRIQTTGTTLGVAVDAVVLMWG